MDLAAIKDFWEQSGKALDAEATITPTSRDLYLAQLERKNVLDHLAPTDHVLEVGCGIGAHSLHYARAVKSLVGVDIAASLLEHARKMARSEQVSNVSFVEGSVLELASLPVQPPFDVVISQRCLINLPSWSEQRSALDQISKVLRPGGLLLMTEGFQEGLEALNAVRQQVGLESIRVVPYNRNFRTDEFEVGIEGRFAINDMRSYGTYLLLSRVLHPLIVAPDPPRHDSPINHAAMVLSEAINRVDDRLSEFSYNHFYALRRL